MFHYYILPSVYIKFSISEHVFKCSFSFRDSGDQDGRWNAVTGMEQPQLNLLSHAVNCAGCGETN